MKFKSILSAVLFGLAAPLMAQAQYQATGPVLEVTDTKLVISKDKGKWEIARTPETKIEGDLKVGSKVTVMYTMQAAAITVKPGKAEKVKESKDKAAKVTEAAAKEVAKPAEKVKEKTTEAVKAVEKAAEKAVPKTTPAPAGMPTAPAKP